MTNNQNEGTEMDFNLIKKYVKLFEESNISELEIEQDSARIKISKKVETSVQVHNVATPVNTPAVAATKSEASQPKEEKNSKIKEIKSPIVGTFYRAPGPDADPYVKVGDMVSSGSVLCIIEAMKLMNEIESDITGKIVKILVENGKPVEYNQPLMLIEAD
ncbi:MAG: acetyl-CoA carboxylase biotin carboxyl carrier protein [Ignavibacteria bacterium]|nr:acetyl-CoA carboxylase biotin carboxyl carrier protein [Ignavibacteria bacterium]